MLSLLETIGTSEVGLNAPSHYDMAISPWGPGCGVECGGLNKNGPHRFIYLNA